jgi:hypothetical protein
LQSVANALQVTAPAAIARGGLASLDALIHYDAPTTVRQRRKHREIDAHRAPQNFGFQGAHGGSN